MSWAGAVGAIGVAALGALVAGCDDNFHDDYNLVEGLRLLGVVAEPPEARPGETVRLAAAAANVSGSPIAFRWGVCTLPPIPGTGRVNPGCLDPAPPGPGVTWTAFTGAAADLVIPALTLAELGPADATGGRYLPVRIGLADGAGSLDALYRLRVHPPGNQAGDANKNPVIERIEVTSRGGAPWDEQSPLAAGLGEALTLRARMSAGSAERYRADLGDGHPRDLDELISITWFATAGRFRDGSTGDGVDTLLDLAGHPPAPGQTVQLWVVARDGRGGSAVAQRTMQVN